VAANKHCFKLPFSLNFRNAFEIPTNYIAYLFLWSKLSIFKKGFSIIQCQPSHNLTIIYTANDRCCHSCVVWIGTYLSDSFYRPIYFLQAKSIEWFRAVNGERVFKYLIWWLECIVHVPPAICYCSLVTTQYASLTPQHHSVNSNCSLAFTYESESESEWCQYHVSVRFCILCFIQLQLATPSSCL
jgi:hypothetical protein